MSLNCVFITVGYPSKQHPDRGIFTHRMVQELSHYVDPLVIHLRAWQPWLPIKEKRELDNIPVYSISVPQLPFAKTKRINTLILAKFGKIWASNILQKADIFHSSGLFPTGYIATDWALAYQKPHVSHAMGTDVNKELIDSRISGDDKSWLLKLNGVVCNSKNIASRLLNIEPGVPNVKVIYRGVDTKIFFPNDVSGVPSGKPGEVQFLFLGGFQTWDTKHYALENVKGGHILLEAWKKVEMHIGESTLVIGGPGTNKHQLDRWRSTLKRPYAVVIMSAIEPDKVPELLRRNDVVIIPSLSEGLPNLANEAQATAKPVLGSDAGGIPETVLHGSTGRIVKKGDVDQLAEGILWFYHHQNHIAEMGNQARQHMHTHFSWERAAQDMALLFEAAIRHYRTTQDYH